MRVTRLLLGALCAAFIGCGEDPLPPPDTTEVSGKVTLANGKPMPAGRVVFYPKGQGGTEAAAEVENGTYNVKLQSTDYLVVIEPMTYKSGSAKPVRLNISKKYQSKQSPLSFTAEGAQAEYSIHLK